LLLFSPEVKSVKISSEVHGSAFLGKGSRRGSALAEIGFAKCSVEGEPAYKQAGRRLSFNFEPT